MPVFYPLTGPDERIKFCTVRGDGRVWIFFFLPWRSSGTVAQVLRSKTYWARFLLSAKTRNGHARHFRKPRRAHTVSSETGKCALPGFKDSGGFASRADSGVLSSRHNKRGGAVYARNTPKKCAAA